MTVYILFRIPRWGFYNNFMKNNIWTATMFHVLATQQTTFMFLITLFISINRCIAVKYPLSYKLYFSKSKIVFIILLFSIVLSTIIGLGTILFNPRYIKSDLYGYLAPSLTSKNEIYYQIFCQVFLSGIIYIATCIFNVMTILTLKNHNQLGNKYKKELYYTIYSTFIFLTLSTVEAYYICKSITLKYEI
uniref:7TM_GPCR_Srx domain-containing protein n=1 Tax=Strongyloides papillosus TaxID=174720 RepID=A0A0N5BZ14_STREA